MPNKIDDRDTFYPRGGLEGRRNFKRYVYIALDGSTTERTYLHILNKRDREEIICKHYLQFLSRYVLRTQLGVKVLSRDDPWDFRIKLSTGAIVNVEVVSVADNALQYQQLLREEARDKFAYHPQITLRELQKLRDGFPSDYIDGIIEEHKRAGLQPNDSVPNPHHKQHTIIYLGLGAPPDGEFSERLKRAILKKERKAHADKENTVLILDNRSSIYYIDEAHAAIESIRERLSQSPFKEIWLYTGYCSDSDGNNGEFSIIPVRVPPETLLVLDESLSRPS